VCATVAFGMGMDVPGIALIVHWDAAQSLQEYVQQIGRGGRDGTECLCITMYEREFIAKCMKRASRERKLQEVGSLIEVCMCLRKRTGYAVAMYSVSKKHLVLKRQVMQ
jgi:ATP-dependent DNA helicase RecQ